MHSPIDGVLRRVCEPPGSPGLGLCSLFHLHFPRRPDSITLLGFLGNREGFNHIRRVESAIYLLVREEDLSRERRPKRHSDFTKCIRNI